MHSLIYAMRHCLIYYQFKIHFPIDFRSPQECFGGIALRMNIHHRCHSHQLFLALLITLRKRGENKMIVWNFREIAPHIYMHPVRTRWKICLHIHY